MLNLDNPPTDNSAATGSAGSRPEDRWSARVWELEDRLQRAAKRNKQLEEELQAARERQGKAGGIGALFGR